jgi:lipoprotein signal peptidase
MKRNTLYTILIVLIIGLFTTNFIIFRMKNDLLTTITTLTLIVGGILNLRDNFKRKKIN